MQREEVRGLPKKAQKKIAVVFPGIGYHRDKPLLYHACRLAGQRGYEIVCAQYQTLPSGVKGNPQKMREAFEIALTQVEEQLAGCDFSSCDKVLFVSKSIGTAVAAAYDARRRIGAGHVYYTPVAESFQAMGGEGIVFHGTADDWAQTEVIRAECEKRGLSLFVTQGANHSMETGNVLADLDILRQIMEETDRYIRSFDRR